MKKAGPLTRSLSESDFAMSKTKSAFGRHALSVRIVTELPVSLQYKSDARFKRDTKPIIVSLVSAIIRVTESASGELVIEIEPP
jgi:hypothetical protein